MSTDAPSNQEHEVPPTLLPGFRGLDHLAIAVPDTEVALTGK